ncbi:opacity protein [Sphingomonas rubra]|uniref:Outer membrane immunogenic protein n=1 Tax=Sphingomonas rubra TaxID=634430 RepID=A0A1I5SIU6_9SPHN|nr:opacity protein [Sphingomonas rubra]SFP70276.1 outer membrane immunogenic protein [Sphingomonas rubra]
MRSAFLATAALAAVAFAAPALAQDAGGEPLPAGTATAPDGTRAFGIEPYVAVLGGYEKFDRNPGHGIPATPIGGNKLDGGLVQGIVGVNVPLGPVFVGAEGNVTKGFTGDIDWQYGAAGRFGFRAGESGLFYGKVGYQWVNFDRFGNNSRDYDAVTYGIGAEVGPKDIGLGGITGNSGVRFRMEVSTFGSADSFRPMAGAVFHF